MMNQASNVKVGTIIIGKWNGNHYNVMKLLGQGATGSVYLANSKNGKAAIKLSENSMAITSEVNVLKHFSKVQGSTLGPSLLDVDDWNNRDNKMVSFYVMEYINGESFLDFIKRRGIEWVDVLIIQLLSNLEELHEKGWIFGDLKPDNLLIAGPPHKIRCIDVGGTTQIGRSVKEFTEFFDRGYWGLGSRKAEPSYDLFSVAMIIINAVYPKRFPKKTNGMEGRNQLIEIINSHVFLRKHKKLLINAILGKYISAEEMKNDLLGIISNSNHQSIKKKSIVKQQSSIHNGKQSKSHMSRKQLKQKRKRKKYGGLIETVVILVGVFIMYSLYVFHYLM